MRREIITGRSSAVITGELATAASSRTFQSMVELHASMNTTATRSLSTLAMLDPTGLIGASEVGAAFAKVRTFANSSSLGMDDRERSARWSCGVPAYELQKAICSPEKIVNRDERRCAQR